MTSRVDDNEIKISGYTHVRCNSTSPHTGGVVFYVSELWEVNTLEEIAVNLELWWLKIKVTLCAQSFILAGLYRSPSSSTANFGEFFKEYMERLTLHGKDIVLMGDFNIDWLVSDTYKLRIS